MPQQAADAHTQQLGSPGSSKGKPAGRVLHLFSGPSTRSDGIKALLKGQGWKCDDYDIVNGPEQDLSRDDTWTQLLVRVKCKQYAAVIMGPPCSTFSRAREKPGGPRPLRSADAPYGLPREGLTEPEKKELKLGNFYMIMAAAVFRAAMAVSVPAVFENPEPVQGHPSAFLLDEYQALAREQGVATVNFDQCCLGAETTKPTRLLASGLDLSGLAGQRCNHTAQCWAWVDLQGRPRRSWGPHPPLVGRKRSDGQFATRAAAAYPADMNRALVQAVLKASRYTRLVPRGGAAGQKRPMPPPPPRDADPLGIGDTEESGLP